MNLENRKICRLCTKNLEEDNENDLFSKSNKHLLQQIKELTGVTIKNLPRQKLPHYCCSKCKDDLTISYGFRKRVIESQAFFKSKNYQNAESQQENRAHIFDTVFIPTFEENSNREVMMRSLSNESLNYKDEDAITTITAETLIDIKIENLQNSNDAMELCLRNEHLTEMEREPEKITPTTKLEQNINDDSLDYISEDSDSELSDITIQPAKKKRKLHIKIKKEGNAENSLENKLICDICNISFKTQKLLKLHKRNEHKRDKRVKCDLCDEMFFTVKSLMRHSSFHKGEKPYKCHYCDMTFTYSSHRTRHERRNHARDCAFLCSLCGKTFTTHDMGKNHMLVHTKERSFHCTCCKASFLRKTHLRTHYRSETHKNNEQKFKEQNQAMANIIPVLNLHLQNNQEVNEEPINT